jgi:hypothetical protein
MLGNRQQITNCTQKEKTVKITLSEKRLYDLQIQKSGGQYIDIVVRENQKPQYMVYFKKAGKKF